jgi:hypothetical protein
VADDFDRRPVDAGALELRPPIWRPYSRVERRLQALQHLEVPGIAGLGALPLKIFEHPKGINPLSNKIQEFL